MSRSVLTSIRALANAVFLLWASLLVACGEPLATPEPLFLEATGSTAMLPLVAELAAAHSEQRPLVSLEVTGVGTRAGLAALRAGEVDVAMASWLPSERSVGLQATAIARDGIAVIVHPSNSVDGIGLLQLRDLFSGRFWDWEGVGGKGAQGSVQPVSRELGSGTRAAFETFVMEGRGVTPLAIVVPSSKAVVEYVADHPGAVGYVSVGYVSSEVKPLKVEGELPTPYTLERGSYPLTRELWLLSTDPPQPAVQALVQFARGAAGQQIVGSSYGRIK